MIDYKINDRVAVEHIPDIRPECYDEQGTVVEVLRSPSNPNGPITLLRVKLDRTSPQEPDGVICLMTPVCFRKVA